MKNIIENIKTSLKLIFPGLYNFYLNKKYKILDDEGHLIYIHIGKCGGKSLLFSLEKSIKAQQYKKIHRIHIRKPPVYKRAHYTIVVRNPIQRAISAFNWRYKIVIDEKSERSRFKGEYEVLKKYENLNALVEKLYIDNKLNKKVANDFRKIHHLKEDITYYLKPLIEKINKKQIFAIFSTETLDEDINNILKVKNDLKIHKHADQLAEYKKTLSERGYKNLKKFLKSDYDSLKELIEMNNSTAVAIDKLLI